MRLSLLSFLLLAAAADAPAAATQPSGEDSVEQPSEPRAPEPAPRARSERAERPSRGAEPAPRPARSEWVERRGLEREVDVIPQAPPPGRQERAGRSEPRQASPVPGVAAASVARPRRQEQGRPGGSDVRGGRRADDAAGAGWRDGRGERRNQVRDEPVGARSPVFGSAIPTPVTVIQPQREVSPGNVAAGNLRNRIGAEGLRQDRIGRESWRREWRGDRRYDWRRVRDRDRARFHLGIYIDPFGWGYRDYDLGWRLPARYYASRYWILDHDRYRLPPVGGPYRWIRYHNDVLLVDLRDGRVLDRIRGFFW